VNERARSIAVGLLSVAFAVVFVAQAAGRFEAAEPVMLMLMTALGAVYAAGVKRPAKLTPADVKAAQARALAVRARGLRDRAAFWTRTASLELENDITPGDYSDELAAIDAELGEVEAELELLEAPFVAPPMALDNFPAVPVVNLGTPDRPVDPYGRPLDPCDVCRQTHCDGYHGAPRPRRWPPVDPPVDPSGYPIDPVRAEDIDRVFGFEVDHATGTVDVQGGSLTKAEADGLKALWKATRSAPARRVHDDATCQAWCQSYHPTNPSHRSNRCTCAEHVGCGIPDCPIHQLS